MHVNLALRVLDLVDCDRNDTENQEEGCHDRRGDHVGPDRVLVICDIVELCGKCVLICSQVLAEVVQWPCCTVNWIQSWERCDFVLIGDECLMPADDHKDGRVLDSGIHVARVWLDQDVEV